MNILNNDTYCPIINESRELFAIGELSSSAYRVFETIDPREAYNDIISSSDNTVLKNDKKCNIYVISTLERRCELASVNGDRFIIFDHGMCLQIMRLWHYVRFAIPLIERGEEVYVIKEGSSILQPVNFEHLVGTLTINTNLAEIAYLRGNYSLSLGIANTQIYEDAAVTKLAAHYSGEIVADGGDMEILYWIQRHIILHEIGHYAALTDVDTRKMQQFMGKSALEIMQTMVVDEKFDYESDIRKRINKVVDYESDAERARLLNLLRRTDVNSFNSGLNVTFLWEELACEFGTILYHYNVIAMKFKPISYEQYINVLARPFIIQLLIYAMIMLRNEAGALILYEDIDEYYLSMLSAAEQGFRLMFSKQMCQYFIDKHIAHLANSKNMRAAVDRKMALYENAIDGILAHTLKVNFKTRKDVLRKMQEAGMKLAVEGRWSQRETRQRARAQFAPNAILRSLVPSDQL